jgi:hypothetical protein
VIAVVVLLYPHRPPEDSHVSHNESFALHSNSKPWLIASRNCATVGLGGIRLIADRWAGNLKFIYFYLKLF